MSPREAARVSGAAPAARPGAALPRARWALLYGNFAIGCGVMVVPGALNDLVRSLQVSVALGGQLVTLAAGVMCFGAPLLAAALGGWDRRRLLVLSLVLYAVGHALSALAPGYAALAALRAVTVLGAAVFTPQAAAAVTVMAEPAERGRALTFVFLGWSVASVFGMPMASYVGEAHGWRWAFGLVALLAAVGAWVVWRAMPDGVRPPAMNLAAWRKVFAQPVLVAIVLVTALSASGQFTAFPYFAPYFRQVLGTGPGAVSFLFLWFGAFGLAGNLLMARYIDRVGTSRAVAMLLACMALSMAAWPLAASAWTMALALVPWGLACFATNSAQQARLGNAAPALAPALMALNTSAIYLGQMVGAASGGAMVAALGWGPLHWAGLAWLASALALSRWATRRTLPRPVHA